MVGAYQGTDELFQCYNATCRVSYEEYTLAMTVIARISTLHPVIIYTMIFLCWFAPGMVTQSVMMPFHPAIYANSSPSDDTTAYVQTNYFDDYATFYVPEVQMQLDEPRSSWITTWTSRVEMGRPLAHLAGFSPAYVVSWVLMLVIDDAFLFFTVMFMLWVYLAGLFALLYVKLLSSDNIAAIIVGILFAFNPYLFFWNTFITFVAALTWGMALVYALTRLQRSQSLANTILVAFSVYSIIYTVYPQISIHLIYLITGYTAWLLWHMPNWHSRRRFVGFASLAVVSAVVLCIPVLRDVSVQMQLSDLRKLLPETFFATNVPVLTEWQDLVRTMVGYVYSNVLQTTPAYDTMAYPISRRWLVSMLAFWGVIAVYFAWNRVWGWVLWLAIAALLSIHRPIFVFAEALGLPQFSRGLLLGSATQYIPHIVMATIGLIQRNNIPERARLRGGIIVGACFLLLLAITCLQGAADGKPIFWTMVLIEALIIVGCTYCFIVPRSGRWQLGVLVIVIMQAVIVVRPYWLVQPQTHVIRTSETVQAIQGAMPTDGKFVLVYSKPARQLEANYTAFLKLNNVGAYSSLPSRYYVAIMQSFGIEFDAYIRNIRSIPATFPDTARWMANIHVIASEMPQDFAGATLVTRSNGVYVYQYAQAMGCCAWIAAADMREQSSSHWYIDAIQDTDMLPVRTTTDSGDVKQLTLPARNSAGIVIISQAYHPDWYATVTTPAGESPAATVIINDGYQGVNVPAEATQVTLRFMPWVWWSWIGHVWWLLCGLFLIYRHRFTIFEGVWKHHSL